MELAELSLTEFLARYPRPTDTDGQPVPLAVIFDQFEELFTFYPERWRERRSFFEQIKDALESDPLLRIVFVMREDYLAEIDAYTILLPGRARARLRLERLRAQAALLAITRPVESTGRSFEPGVAEQLVDELLRIKLPKPKARETDSAVAGEFIEPAQLQAVCQRIWKNYRRVQPSSQGNTSKSSEMSSKC